MLATIGVIGYMCFAFAIYMWATRSAPDEQEIVGVTTLERERAREAELIDLMSYFESRPAELEETRRAA